MRRRILTWIATWLGPLMLRAWFGTIRFRWHGAKTIHPDPRVRGHFIYVLWHQRVLAFAYTHAGFGGRVLVSQSRDGDIIACVAAGLGFLPIRGSSRRGGSEAMRALLTEAQNGYDFGITPDGPTGPPRTFKVGAVFLASQSGLPIVPIAVAYRRCWQFKSWDRFQLPWPFTRGVVHAGEPVAVPPALDDAGLETWRVRFEEILEAHTRMTDERFEEFFRSGQRRRDLLRRCGSAACST